jgi:hypothetical protein
MAKKVMGASPTEARGEHDVDKLDFLTVSKKVSPKKGSYQERSTKKIILTIVHGTNQKADEKPHDGLKRTAT